MNGSLFIGLGSLVEDVHDISMHTVGYDLEITEVPEDELEDAEEAEAEAEETQAAPEENAPIE